MKIKVEIVDRQRKIRISSKRLATTARKILNLLLESTDKDKIKTLNHKIILLSIVLIGRRKMKEINYKYRGKNYTTDVLSFSYLGNNNLSEEIYLGEILINPEKAKYQAITYKVSFWQEIKRLLIHGILHLFGYDHEISSKHAKKMLTLERKILERL